MHCLIYIAFLLIPAILSSPLNQDKHASHVNIRLINEIHSPRLKRSIVPIADDEAAVGMRNLPDHLVFGVPVDSNQEEAVLRLRRASVLPTVTSDGRTDGLHENAAVYTDTSRHSSMIVRRKADDYSLQGTFQHSGREWNLQPLSRNSRSAESHQLSPLRAKPGHEVISFVGDEYTIDGKRIEETPRVNTTRHRRAVTQHVVEMAFVVDYEDYTKWVALVGSSDAINEMRLWYTYVAESINIRYNTIQDSDIAISTRVNILKIITRDADDDFIEDIVTSGQFDGLTGLQEFRSWVGQQGDIPISDHYMLFTGFDIQGASGIAFGSAVCSSSSVSISENDFQASLGGIAAHELGHSLSAIHDSSDGCDDTDQYIMSTILSTPVDVGNEGNPWTFSQCSVTKFKNYLRGETCTLPERTSGEDVLPPPQAGQRAGQVLSLDDQCRWVFQDESSSFCTGLQIQQGGLDTLCGGMYCAIPGRPGVCQTSLPQEFSPCGTEKWCVLGQCVNVPTTQEPTTTTPTTTTTTTPTTTTTTTTPTTTTTTTTPTTTTTTTPTTTTTTTTPTTTTTKTPTTTTTTTTPTTTTTTTAPTTTTTTTTPTTTTTTVRPTTTTTTPTTTTPTTTTPTTTTTKPGTTAPPTEIVFTTERVTSAVPTASTTTSITTTTTTTTARPGPVDVSDCFVYIFKDWDKWWQCVRKVYLARRKAEQEERQRRREEQRRRQQEQQKKQQEQQKNKQKQQQQQQQQERQKQQQQKNKNNRRF